MTGNLQLPHLAELVKPAGEGTQFYSFMSVALEERTFVKVKAEPSAQRELRELPFFLLKRASILSATDPKDKIYGILRLLDLAGAKIPVDYASDIVSVYRDTLLTLAKEAGRLDVLFFAVQNVTTPDWPSWVPDFTCTDKRDMDDRFSESSLITTSSSLTHLVTVSLNAALTQPTRIYCTSEECCSMRFQR
jgi:hypothetical protein